MKPENKFTFQWLALIAAALIIADTARGETICAEITEHNQIPVWSYHDEVWLDCESAQ